MKSIITVIGKDRAGIIAGVSSKCFEYNVNIIDITQKVFSDTFAMIMMADISGLKITLSEFVDVMEKYGEQHGLVIHTMHEDIFNSMHRI